MAQHTPALAVQLYHTFCFFAGGPPPALFLRFVTNSNRVGCWLSSLNSRILQGYTQQGQLVHRGGLHAGMHERWTPAKASCPPATGVQLDSVKESHCHEPCIAVHCHERQPVALLHAIARKVDSQARLRQLGRDLFNRKIYAPCAVPVAWAREQGQMQVDVGRAGGWTADQLAQTQDCNQKLLTV